MKKNTKFVLITLSVVVAIAVAPLVLRKGSEFSGADGQAEEEITRIDPSYEPWFSSLVELPSGEVESLMFALQAALGAGFIGYYLAYAKYAKRDEKAKDKK